jgi:hypothetical protein
VTSEHFIGRTVTFLGHISLITWPAERLRWHHCVMFPALLLDVTIRRYGPWAVCAGPHSVH